MSTPLETSTRVKVRALWCVCGVVRIVHSVLRVARVALRGVCIVCVVRSMVRRVMCALGSATKVALVDT